MTVGVFAGNNQTKSDQASLSKHPTFYSNNPRRMQSAKSRLQGTPWNKWYRFFHKSSNKNIVNEKKERWIENLENKTHKRMGHAADLNAWPLSGPHTDKHAVIWGKANTAWGLNDTKKWLFDFSCGNSIAVSLNTNFLSFRDTYSKHLKRIVRSEVCFRII